MKKVEVKQMLREMGVNPILTEMPCVIEPVYKEVYEKTIEQVKRSGKIKVEENGNCSFYGIHIALNEDGTATIGKRNPFTKDIWCTIKTNNCGIEVSCQTGDPMDFSTWTSRSNGIIIDTDDDSGSCRSSDDGKHFDNGHWSILDSKGERMRESSYYSYPEHIRWTGKTVDFDEEMVLKEFDEMATSMIQDYPQTAEWYSTTRECIVETIAREKNPILRAKLDIEALRSQATDLNNRNKILIQEIQIHASELKRNLELLEAVKDSPAGKLLFKNVLQKYEKFREKRINTKTQTRFHRKVNSSTKSQEEQDNTTMNLGEIEGQEIKQLRIQVKSLERKVAYLKATNKELTRRKSRLEDREYFTREIVNDFNKSSIIKKAIFYAHKAMKKCKQHNEDDFDR